MYKQAHFWFLFSLAVIMDYSDLLVIHLINQFIVDDYKLSENKQKAHHKPPETKMSSFKWLSSLNNSYKTQRDSVWDGHC